jgi:metal-responsive CopG/Arc/MetJ family transcriptional regulator
MGKAERTWLAMLAERWSTSRSEVVRRALRETFERYLSESDITAFERSQRSKVVALK